MAYVVIAVLFGISGGVIGKLKGSSFWLWFLISGLVPFFGLMAAIAYRFERDEFRRRCPKCGNVTKIYDAICLRCGEELEFPDVAIQPESWVRTPASPGAGPPSPPSPPSAGSPGTPGAGAPG